MKKIWKIVGIAAAILLVGCAVLFIVCAGNNCSLSTGRFFMADNGSVMLLDDYGATVLYAQKAGIFEKLNNGDKILVLHGGIEESYPARTRAYYCIRLEEGRNEDLPENVLSSLRELGWLTQTAEPDPKPDIKTEIPFSVQYIRTNGDSGNIPNVTVVISAQQLQKYYEDNKERFDLERRQQVSSDSTIGFLDACDKYTDDFFADNMLLLITLEEGSGSTRHKVTRVETDAVYLESVTPEAGTCDMAQWHIMVAVPKSSAMSEADDIRVIYDGKDITEKYQIASCETEHSGISLMLPDGWEYEIISSKEGSEDCGVCIWPSGEAGKISVTYTDSGWGVCGTGLRTEVTQIGGYDASMGFYDGNPIWDYIAVNDLPGAYVIQRQESISWWSEYGDKAMEILSNASLGKEGYITRSDAVSVAKHKLGKAEYESCDDISANCDMENGIWCVEFYKNAKEHPVVRVAIDFYGNILSVSE